MVFLQYWRKWQGKYNNVHIFREYNQGPLTLFPLELIWSTKGKAAKGFYPLTNKETGNNDLKNHVKYNMKQ